MDNLTRLYELCKNCWINETHPKKKMIKHIVLSAYKEPCACCGKIEKLVIDVDTGENE